MRIPGIGTSLIKLAAIMAMLAFASIGPAVSAQEDDTFTLGIVVVNCDVNPPAQITVPEDGCAPGSSIEFMASDADGTVIGSCISQIPDVEDSYTGGCTIEIPFGSTVIVTENMATVPAGYAPMENAQEFTAPDGPPTGFVGGPVFINMLQDGGESVVDNGSDVAEDGLPDTGVGISQPAVTSELGMMLAIGLLVLATGAVSRIVCTRRW